jgi:5-methylcytosine-specific restriction endonuclease McrA
MSIHRAPKDKDHPYAIIETACLEDTRLSWKARGVLVYLLSKPEEWTIRVRELIHASDQNGRQSVRSALKELQACGYARLTIRRDATGQLIGKEWVLLPRHWNPYSLSYDAYLQSPHWHKTRRAALRRAQYQCEHCSSTTALQVHHLSYGNLGKEPPEDLMVLCDPCHKHAHDLTLDADAAPDTQAGGAR